MAALNFKITNAGLGLLSQVGAIGPVTLTKVAIGSAGYTPSGTEATLTTQIKQITPEGSSVPTPGIIHITASDSSSDAYAVKEIGLYAGTTLFAIYSQTTAILTKSSGNVALFSIDLALTNVPAGSVTIGSASFQYPPATESVKGVAEIATTAEVAVGTNDSHIVTPLKLAGSPTFVKKSGDTMTGLLTLAGDPTSALHAATKQYVDAGLNPFSGAVMSFARSTAPSGWLKANGAAVSRTAYASLFTAIGTAFGDGNGTTTFNLPDLRGEFPRGWDDSRGVDSGRTFGSAQADEIKSHRHNTRILRDRGYGLVGNAVLGDEDYYGTQDNLSDFTGGSETRPRNIALLYCIKF